MTRAASILVDTNVLLRRTQPDHEHHVAAVESVAILLGKGETVYFTLQNISEFWNVATRPIENNGLGFSIDLTLSEVEKIERVLTLFVARRCMIQGWLRP
jgi:predicted nucleic acid-binding protein